MQMIRRRFLGLASMLGIGGLAGGLVAGKEALGLGVPTITHKYDAGVVEGSSLHIVAGSAAAGVARAAMDLRGETYIWVRNEPGYPDFAFLTAAFKFDEENEPALGHGPPTLVVELTPAQLRQQGDDLLRAQERFRKIIITVQTARAEEASLSTVLSRCPVLQAVAERAHLVTFVSPVKLHGNIA